MAERIVYTSPAAF
jgi:long-chain-fatty-acid--CoA ligase ACSBG